MSYAASFRLQPALTIDEATAMNGLAILSEVLELADRGFAPFDLAMSRRLQGCRNLLTDGPYGKLANLSRTFVGHGRRQWSPSGGQPKHATNRAVGAGGPSKPWREHPTITDRCWR